MSRFIQTETTKAPKEVKAKPLPVPGKYGATQLATTKTVGTRAGKV